MARNTPQLHVNRSSPAAKRKEKKKRAGLRQPGPKPVTENGPLMPEGPSRCSASLRAARSNRTASAAWSPNKSADRPNPSHFLPLPPHFSLAKRAAVPRPLGAAAALAGGACSRMNPARSPIERCPGVRAHGASRREEGRRPPRHEERRRLARRRPRQGRVHSSGSGGGSTASRASSRGRRRRGVFALAQRWALRGPRREEASTRRVT